MINKKNTGVSMCFCTPVHLYFLVSFIKRFGYFPVEPKPPTLVADAESLSAIKNGRKIP